MSDLEDISREVWDVAFDIAEGHHEKVRQTATLIARAIQDAILSERTKAAEIAESFYDHVPDELRDAQDPYLVEATRLISQAIRKGGKE